MTHEAARPNSRVSTGAARFGALAIVLLVLYYSLTATLEVRALHAQLDAQNDATLIARAQAAEERNGLQARLDTLQADLDDARAEVASLREQLITAGITPVTVLPSGQANSVQPYPEPQEAAGAPEPAPQVQAPQQAAPQAPSPAPVAPAPLPAPSPPAATVGGDHILCVLTLCI